jgi:hypothetical protein
VLHEFQHKLTPGTNNSRLSAILNLSEVDK